MLDYRFKVFQAVANELNFTRAAEALHISQPAVTQHVKALEESYGTPLFRRGPNGVSLTAAGQLLLSAVVRGADLERQTDHAIRRGHNLLAGPLRLGASTTIAQYFLPAPLGTFRRDHPAVELTLQIGNTREIADAVRTGRIDLGLVEGPSERRDLHASPFYEDEIVCIASPRHAFAGRSRTTPANLLDAEWVMREPGSGTRDVVERALKHAGVRAGRRRVVLETDSSETIKGLVASGAGVAFISRLAIAAELATHTLVIVPIAGLRITRSFFFLHPQGPRPAGAIGAFMDAIAERAAATA